MAVARQFLKDNGIDAVPEKGSGLQKLQQAARPFPDPDAIAREGETHHR